MAVEANHYKLRDEKIRITYSSTSFDGTPRLDYEKGGRLLSFSGDQIREQASEMGTLVTVTLKALPDLRTVILTLLVPQVNLTESKPRRAIRTLAVVTTIRTTIGGPGLVDGPVQTYKALALRGSARHIVALASSAKA